MFKAVISNRDLLEWALYSATFGFFLRTLELRLPLFIKSSGTIWSRRGLLMEAVLLSGADAPFARKRAVTLFNRLWPGTVRKNWGLSLVALFGVVVVFLGAIALGDDGSLRVLFPGLAVVWVIYRTVDGAYVAAIYTLADSNTSPPPVFPSRCSGGRSRRCRHCRLARRLAA